MEQESPSFWADIKKYEETLEKDPNSYCFAPLSELYRKLGMVDDAITIAKRGCELHPDYVGGYMALGRGYYEKGMNAEARDALEKVVRVTPDNLLAQRILSKIYIDSGDTLSAKGALQAILAQNPEDSESRILLDSLIRTSADNQKPIAGFYAQEDASEIDVKGKIGTDYDHFEIEELDEEIIDLEGCEIIEEFEKEGEQLPQEEAVSVFEIETHEILDEKEIELIHTEEPEKKDPLNTITLAELYIAQGFQKQALKIFRELSEADPENVELKNRILALKREIDEHEEEPARKRIGDLETISEPVASGIEEGRVDLEIPELPLVEPELTPYSGIPEQQDTKDLSAESVSPTAPEEHVIHTLEIWLENIKRRR